MLQLLEPAHECHHDLVVGRKYRLLPISPKKQSISGDKKNIPKKTSSFRENKKYFSSYVFLLVFFSSPSLTFFKIGQIRNIIVACTIVGANWASIWRLWTSVVPTRDSATLVWAVFRWYNNWDNIVSCKLYLARCWPSILRWWTGIVPMPVSDNNVTSTVER